jgi:ketosteroid isomerase-like protein
MDRQEFSGITIRPVPERADGGAPPPDGPVDSISHLVDATSSGRLDEVMRSAHADVQLDVFAPPELPWIRRATGGAALRRALAHNFDSVVDQRPTLTSVMAQHDTVVLIGHETGRLKAAGTPYRMEFVQRFRFRDGRLAAITIIAAHASAEPGDPRARVDGTFGAA